MPIIITGTPPTMPRRYAIAGAAALRAKEVHQHLQNEYLAYLNSVDDGFGGEFVYDSTATTADDNMDYIKPNNVLASSPGRWVRQNNLT